MSTLYCGWVNVAEIADRPMSAPPPSPQNAMTFMGSSVLFPLRISALRAAAVPRPAEHELPRWVCIHGATHDVLEQVVFATHMQPLLLSSMVRGPAAWPINSIT